MVAAEAPLLLQTHRSECGSYGPLSRSQDRTCQKQPDMPQTRSEKSGTKGASTCTIVVGRVRISRSPLLSELVTSVPYPFRLQMAKVQLSTRVNKGRRNYGSLTHGKLVRDLGLLAHHQQQRTPPGGRLRSHRHAPRQPPADLGSDLRYPRGKPAASSRLCCPHPVPAYPPPPLPLQSRFGCGL